MPSRSGSSSSAANAAHFPGVYLCGAPGRFVFANDTFSPARPDAETFSMSAQVTPEGVLNITDVVGTPAFFTKPHYGGDTIFKKVVGYPDFDPEADDSYIDVEPTLGE